MNAVGPWTLLVMGGVLEMVWALGFKYVKGDAPWWQHAGVLLALVGSMVLLIAAMRHLPAGTSYAVWTGIGTVGVAVIGILVFKEPVTIARIFFLALIVLGILGLRLTATAS